MIPIYLNQSEWSENGDYLATTSGNSIQIWDPLKEKIIHEVNGHSGKLPSHSTLFKFII
jgi:WD40 repeat protein